MGTSHKAVPIWNSNLPFNRIQTQELTERDGALSLSRLEERSLSKNEEEQIAQQRLNAVLGEQILALYDEYRPRLFRYMRSMSLNRDQSEEVIQETFVRLTSWLLGGESIDNLQGWVVRVAHNLAIDVLKRNGRDSLGPPDLVSVSENRVDPTPNPEEEYSRKEQIRRMEIALSNFNPKQRECFLLRAQGFRYRDIGQMLSISEQRAALIVKQVSIRLAALCG